MKHIFLIIFYPAKAASSSGCFLGFVVAFAYIAIVVVTAITLLFNAIGSCEGGNDNYSGGGTSTYYTNPNPHQREESRSSGGNSGSSQTHTMSVTNVIELNLGLLLGAYGYDNFPFVFGCQEVFDCLNSVCHFVGTIYNRFQFPRLE